MSDQTLELIAVSCPVDHPTGIRRRAGFIFTVHPTIAAVTPEQRAVIKADTCLRIHRRLSASWFAAMGIERTAANEKEFAKEDPENWADVANVAPRTDGTGVDANAKVKTQHEGLEEHVDGQEDLTLAEQEARAKEKAKVEGKEEEKNDKKEEKKEEVKEKPEVTGGSSKESIIAALLKKGKKAGVDFDPAASRNALWAVYKGA